MNILGDIGTGAAPPNGSSGPTSTTTPEEVVNPPHQVQIEKEEQITSALNATAEVGHRSLDPKSHAQTNDNGPLIQPPHTPEISQGSQFHSPVRTPRIQHPSGKPAQFDSTPKQDLQQNLQQFHTPRQPVPVPSQPATPVQNGTSVPVQAHTPTQNYVSAQNGTPVQNSTKSPINYTVPDPSVLSPKRKNVADSPRVMPPASMKPQRTPQSPQVDHNSMSSRPTGESNLRQRGSTPVQSSGAIASGVANGSQQLPPPTVDVTPPGGSQIPSFKDSSSQAKNVKVGASAGAASIGAGSVSAGSAGSGSGPGAVAVDTASKHSTEQAGLAPQRGQTKETGATADPNEVSKDLDMSNIKTKPAPRKPQMPTYRGWREVGHFESEDVMTKEDEETDLTSKLSFFDAHLPSIMIGDWYHNVAWLSIGALLSWFFGYFRFSLGPVFFVMLTCSIIYRSSVRKYREQLREEAQREFSIKQIETDYETIDWLNVTIEKFWYFLEPSISQIVCQQVNATLITLPIPGFIKQIWVDSFTAGTKPFRIEMVKTLSGTRDDVVVMDWGFSFCPNSLVDASYKQQKSHVNQKVVVKAELFGVSIPVAVSDVSCYAVARVRIRMMESFPHIQTINVSLLNPPKFDFCSRLLSDSQFNWEVLDIPGVFPFINEMVTKYAGPMFFSPMSFQLNVQQLLAGNALDSSIGVLCITAKSADGIKGIRSLDNSMDPYLTYSFVKNKVLGKTKVIENTYNPTWNEKTYIPVKSLTDPLMIQLWDYNTIRTDRQVGIIQMDLEGLEQDTSQSNVVQDLTRNTKRIGHASFDLKYFPCEEATMGADGAITPPPDLNTGIARICVAEGRHLKLEGSDKAPNVQVELFLDSKMVEESAFVNSETPGWNMVNEKIIVSRSKARVKVVVKDKSGKKLGVIQKYLNELIDATQVQQSWYSLAKGGEVRVDVQWKPVELDIGDPVSYTPPIGVVRVAIDSAEDLRNLETIGKVDPYVRMFVNGVERGRTRAINDTLDPSWNEGHYVTVSSANQLLTLEVMDVERHSPDRTLGKFDVRLNEIISRNEKGDYIEHQDSQKRVSKLIHKKGVKGTLTYSLSFFPCLPIKTLQDIEEEKKDAKYEEETKKQAEQRQEEKKNLEEKLSKLHRGPRHHKIKKQLEVLQKQILDYGDDADAETVDTSLANDDGGTSKLHLPLNELVDFKSGVLVFELQNPQLAKDDYYIQVFFDNHGHYDFQSPKMSKKRQARQQDQSTGTGDVVITDLDWSECTFRFTTKKDGNRAEKCICETTIPSQQLLKNYYDKPGTIDLAGSTNGQITAQVQWIPVIYEHGVPPQDSKDNQGTLTIDIIKGEQLPSADSNGYSDPFVELYLNHDTKEFYKSNKKKKTLNPNWHEQTTVDLGNRYDTNIRVVCWDWDMAGENDLLGTGVIKLSEANTDGGNVVEVKTPLVGESGEDAGTLYFKLSFKPKVIIQVKPESETKVGDVAKGGATVVKGVGKGVGMVGKGAFTGIGGGLKGLKNLVKSDKD